MYSAQSYIFIFTYLNKSRKKMPRHSGLGQVFEGGAEAEGFSEAREGVD